MKKSCGSKRWLSSWPVSRLPEVAELTERAALLAKCDLETGMVFEFTELQGVMGREYALLDGEDPRVGPCDL